MHLSYLILSTAHLFDSPLRWLDHALGNIRFLLPDLSIDLEDRRKIARLSLLYKILNNIYHPLHSRLSQFSVPTHATLANIRKK